MDRKRSIAVAVLVVIVVGAASAVHYEGDLRPVGAHVDVAIRDSGSWYARPTLVSRDDDPAAVYVVVPELPQGAAFAAVRIDTHTREQTRTRITLGPQSPFRPYLPADVRVQVRGLRFDCPAFHLFSFPDGGTRAGSPRSRGRATPGGSSFSRNPLRIFTIDQRRRR